MSETDGDAMSNLQESFKALRSGFQADGADLQLIGVDGGRARVELVVTSETCLECIVPKPMLEHMLLSFFKSGPVQVDSVELLDPRAPDA